NCGGRVQKACGGTPGGAAEDVVGQGGDFQKDVNGGQEGDEEDRKPGNELHGRERARGRQAERSEHEICDDEHHSGGDDLVEGVLQETTEPAPEEPLELGNNEERHKDW